MKIQIVVAGFNRSLSSTLPSLEEKVIQPTRRWAEEVRVSFILNRSREPIKSNWSGETVAGEFDPPSSINCDDLLLLEQSAIDEEVSDFREEIFAVAKPPTPRDSDIVTNIIRFLKVLKLARTLVSSEFDYVFFTRPDLLFLDRPRIRALTQPLFRRVPTPLFGVAVPSWGGGSHPNDRYALVHHSAVDDYFNRIDKFREFYDQDLPFGSEVFLGYSLREHNVVRALSARAQRIRAGGAPKRESYRYAPRSERVIDSNQYFS